MTGDVQGFGTLGTIILCLIGIVIIAWALSSLRMQFTVGGFILFATVCFFLGMFVESYIQDTKEQVLSGLVLVGFAVGWLGWKLIRGGRGVRK